MGNKIKLVELTITRDLNGCVMYIKSEVLESEAKKYAQGMDDPSTYFIQRRGSDSSFIFNVPANELGGDEVYRALRTKGLGEGLTIKITRPMSPDFTAQVGKNLAEYAKAHVRNHLAAFRVSVSVEVDENSIRWQPLGDGTPDKGAK